MTVQERAKSIGSQLALRFSPIILFDKKRIPPVFTESPNNIVVIQKNHRESHSEENYGKKVDETEFINLTTSDSLAFKIRQELKAKRKFFVKSKDKREIANSETEPEVYYFICSAEEELTLTYYILLFSNFPKQAYRWKAIRIFFKAKPELEYKTIGELESQSNINKNKKLNSEQNSVIATDIGTQEWIPVRLILEKKSNEEDYVDIEWEELENFTINQHPIFCFDGAELSLVNQMGLSDLWSNRDIEDNIQTGLEIGKNNKKTVRGDIEKGDLQSSTVKGSSKQTDKGKSTLQREESLKFKQNEVIFNYVILESSLDYAKKLKNAKYVLTKLCQEKDKWLNFRGNWSECEKTPGPRYLLPFKLSFRLLYSELKHSNSPEYWFSKGFNNFQAGNLEKALDFFLISDKIVKATRSEIKLLTLMNIAVIEFERSNWLEAINGLKKIEKISRTAKLKKINETVNFYLAILHLHTGQLQDATNFLELPLRTARIENERENDIYNIQTLRCNFVLFYYKGATEEMFGNIEQAAKYYSLVINNLMKSYKSVGKVGGEISKELKGGDESELNLLPKPKKILSKNLQDAPEQNSEKVAKKTSNGFLEENVKKTSVEISEKNLCETVPDKQKQQFHQCISGIEKKYQLSENEKNHSLRLKTMNIPAWVTLLSNIFFFSLQYGKSELQEQSLEKLSQLLACISSNNKLENQRECLKVSQTKVQKGIENRSRARNETALIYSRSSSLENCIVIAEILSNVAMEYNQSTEEENFNFVEIFINNIVKTMITEKNVEIKDFDEIIRILKKHLSLNKLMNSTYVNIVLSNIIACMLVDGKKIKESKMYLTQAEELLKIFQNKDNRSRVENESVLEQKENNLTNKKQKTGEILDNFLVVEILNNLGVIAFYEKKYVKAEKLFKESFAISEILNHLPGARDTAFNLGLLQFNCEEVTNEYFRISREASSKLRGGV